MRVVVFGASGNLGTSTLEELSADPAVDEIVAVARRLPASSPLPKVAWRAADIAVDDLGGLVRGADAVVHLAWALQPSGNPSALQQVNIAGSRRVFVAAAGARARALVYASSVGAYSPAPKEQPRDESWPTDGVATSTYSRQKAYVERMLDAYECVHPELRVVRLRPGLVFQAAAAEEIRQLFVGRRLPLATLLRRGVPVVPGLVGLAFQAVHAHDVGRAVARAVTTRATRGAYNLAADPVLTPDVLAEVLGARLVPVPSALARAGISLSFALHLQPSEPGWLDLALSCPLMQTSRARDELGFAPEHSSTAAVRDVLRALTDGATAPTPPLSEPLGVQGAPGS